jgi:periplasmic protein TonB
MLETEVSPMPQRPSSASPDVSGSLRSRDPLAAVLSLGARRVRLGLAVGLAGGLFVHGAAAGHGYAVTDLLRLKNFAAVVRADIRSQMRMTFEIEEEKPPEPEPPEPEPPPPEPEKIEEPLEAPKAQDPNPPPPAAAEAAKILTAEADPNAPLDLTGFTMLSGNAERSPGGLTAASGTSKKPVYDRAAQADGVGSSKQNVPTKAVAASAPDLSRAANIAGGTSWNCPFPTEADLEQINYRRVEILVNVSASGTAEQVSVLKGGDVGFGRQATNCALKKRYAPALDRSGKAIASTLRVNVGFQR